MNMSQAPSLPALDRYHDFLPDLVPVDFLHDWEPGRLESEPWYPEGKLDSSDKRVLRVRRPLFGEDVEVTVGCYLDLDFMPWNRNIETNKKFIRCLIQDGTFRENR